MEKMAQNERLKVSDISAKYKAGEANRMTNYKIAEDRNKTERDKAAATTNVKLTEQQLKAKNIQNRFDTY